MTDLSIDVRELRREFGKFVAVDNVTFEVRKGEIFGYLGANGAGKSTTIRMLCGLLTPTAGHAEVAGCQLGTDSILLRSRIGYMSQKFSLYLDLPVEENIAFFGGAYGLYGKALRSRAEEIIAQVGLSELRRTITADLPGGIRQRLALGTALLHRPQIVFLDEPTAGVDPKSRRMFWNMIRELASGGTTVFVTTHYMDEAEYCARIGLMVAGKLVALDSPKALKAAWVPGRVVALRNTEVNRVRESLRDAPGVLAIEPFGSSVHVRYDEARIDAQELSRRCAAASEAHGLVIEPAEASLEDVFLAAVANGVKS